MADFTISQELLEQRVEGELKNRFSSANDINSMMSLTLVSCCARTKQLELCHSVHPRELNVLGTMHGGLISWVMDSTMAVLLRACTGDFLTPTIDLHVNFLRPIQEGQDLLVQTELLHLGRSTATLHARALADGKLCASATATFFRAKPNV